jgi:hypothetical protein
MRFLSARPGDRRLVGYADRGSFSLSPEELHLDRLTLELLPAKDDGGDRRDPGTMRREPVDQRTGEVDADGSACWDERMEDPGVNARRRFVARCGSLVLADRFNLPATSIPRTRVLGLSSPVAMRTM